MSRKIDVRELLKRLNQEYYDEELREAQVAWAKMENSIDCLKASKDSRERMHQRLWATFTDKPPQNRIKSITEWLRHFNAYKRRIK